MSTGGVSPTHRIDVRVDPSYPVHVGTGVLSSLPDLVVALAARPTRVFVLSDDVVGPLHAGRAVRALAPLGIPLTEHAVPAGERSKTLTTYGDVLDAMARARLDRGSLVVTLGGGVIGDLAGFAAATYMRGLPYLQVPTTLLAMVDSSVGGKTGINLPHGKNLVGAFWQPVAVVADVALLESLPGAERRYGGVELFKAGLLGDPDIVRAFATGRAFGSVVDEGGSALADLIARGIRVKAQVVASDPHEHGARAVLNLGHTVGHAIETLSHRERPGGAPAGDSPRVLEARALAHGEAVAHGLWVAAEIGARRGLFDWRPHAHRLLRWVAPGELPDVSAETLLASVARDKKQVGDRRRFVLLQALGEPILVDDVSDGEITRAWQALREVAR